MQSRQAQGGQAGEAGRRSYRLALERLEERILLGGAFPLGGQEAGDPLVGDLLPGKPSGRCSGMTCSTPAGSQPMGGDLAEIHGRSWHDLDADGLSDVQVLPPVRNHEQSALGAGVQH